MRHDDALRGRRAPRSELQEGDVVGPGRLARRDRRVAGCKLGRRGAREPFGDRHVVVGDREPRAARADDPGDGLRARRVAAARVRRDRDRHEPGIDGPEEEWHEVAWARDEQRDAIAPPQTATHAESQEPSTDGLRFEGHLAEGHVRLDPRRIGERVPARAEARRAREMLGERSRRHPLNVELPGSPKGSSRSFTACRKPTSMERCWNA